MATLQVDQAGREIYYEHYRGDKTPVVLIHGWAMSCRVWGNVTRVLVEAGHEVIAYDQRGCGRSDKDFDDASIAAGAADVVKLMATLNVQSAVLNGWSLGGAIAVAAADKLGDRCKGLVLTCGATPRFEQCADFPHGIPEGGVAGTVEMFNENPLVFLHQLAQGVCAKDPGEGVVDWMAGLFKESGPLAGASIAELGSVDQRAIMKSLTIPVLNIIGAKDGVADPEVGRYACSIQQHGELVEFEDCGHAPFIEDFPRYQAELSRFLNNIN